MQIRVQTSHLCGCGMFPRVWEDGTSNHAQIKVFHAAPECGFDGDYCLVFFANRLL